MRFRFQILSGVAAVLAVASSGCGGGNLAPDCTGFSGQYGAPGSEPALVQGRIVRVYQVSDCDSTGQNCREVLRDTTTTRSDGTFTIGGLTNGNYVVRTYSVDGATLLEENTVSLPDVCRATPTPTPS